MIHKADKSELGDLAHLAHIMWHDSTIEELIEEFQLLLSDDNALLLMKYENKIPVGFAQCQLRHDYVEGTQTSPVGYLEGILVKEEYQNKGYARELLTECEKWARKKGCTEFASDCELDNTVSLQFHKAIGFTEANRIICFTKNL